MMNNLESLNVVRTASIQDAASAVLIASRDLKNPLRLLLIRLSTFPNGKDRIEKKGLNKAVIGMREILKRLETCLLKPLKNISVLDMARTKETKDLLIGIKEILKKEKLMTGQCMRSKQGNLFVLLHALSAKRNVNLMHIMRIIPKLLKSFGCVLSVIFTYIMNQNITVREQARRLRKEMRCAKPLTKAVEISRNEISAILKYGQQVIDSLWQSGGKARFIYMPPGLSLALDKSLLIDLDTYNYAQAA